MGEQTLLTTSETAALLNIPTKTFKRLRHETKDSNGDLIRSLKAITKGKQQVNKYLKSDVLSVKEKMNLVTDKSLVVSSVEAAKILGISKNTFRGYRNPSRERESALANAVFSLKTVNFLALGNYFFKEDVENLVIEKRVISETCAFKDCSNVFVKRGSNHFYCSSKCRFDAKNEKQAAKPRVIKKVVGKPELKKPNSFTKKLDRNKILNTYASYNAIPNSTGRCYAGRIALNSFANECLNCKLSKCEVL